MSEKMPKRNPLAGLDTLATDMAKPPRIWTRRDFIRLGVFLAILAAIARTVWSRVLRPPLLNKADLQNLSPAQALTIQSVAEVMVGPVAMQSVGLGQWDPVRDFDAMLGHLDEQQRQLIGIALTVFEHARIGFGGFSAATIEQRTATLEQWRDSLVGFQRTLWGMLHATMAFSYGSSQPAWSLMGYEGPCVASENDPGRTPGQSVSFAWDPKVP